MYSQTLANLLAGGMFDTTAPNNAALLGAFGDLLDSQYNNGVTLVNNLSPATADINGIVDWEKALGLPSDPTLTLQARRNMCMARAYRLRGALQKSQLVDILNSFSPSKSAFVTEIPNLYKVIGQILVSETPDLNAVLREVLRVLPAHLEFIPSLVAEQPPTFAGAHTSNIVVNLDVYANNGGPLSTGTFLDGTYLLDTSKLLDNPGRPDIFVCHSSLIVAVRYIIESIVETHYSILAASRTVTETITVARPSSIYTSQVRANNTNSILTGHWNLDANTLLNGSAFPQVIKYNGTTI